MADDFNLEPHPMLEQAHAVCQALDECNCGEPAREIIAKAGTLLNSIASDHDNWLNACTNVVRQHRMEKLAWKRRAERLELAIRKFLTETPREYIPACLCSADEHQLVHHVPPCPLVELANALTPSE